MIFQRLLTCERGTFAIEVGVVAPFLILLVLGGIETSRMFQRQHELQAGAAEAESIALAANMGATTDTVAVKSILKDNLDLNDDQVTIAKLLRCDVQDDLVDDTTVNREACGDPDNYSTYMRITLSDAYTPFWVNLGFGGPFSYNVVRMVQLS